MTSQYYHTQFAALTRSYEDACKDAERERAGRSQVQTQIKLLETQLENLQQALVVILLPF